MGISSVLTSALSGLHVNERGLDVVSRNIANAGTPGYTRKVLNRESVLAAGNAVTVQARSIDRQLNEILQRDLRGANSAVSQADVIKQFLDRMDLMFGPPGGASSLDTVFNNFSDSLERLSASPDSTISRQDVIGTAQVMAQQLNGMSAEIQRLRGEINRAMGTAVNTANDALLQLERINSDIIERSAAGAPPPDLLDARDRQIDRLAELMDVQVFEGPTGTVSVFTESGVLLFDAQASLLSFDDRGAVGPDSLYNRDPNLRTVGTISIAISASGYSTDLLQPGMVRSGSIAAYTKLRDDILVQAQNQLDEIANALALAFSSEQVTGTPVVAGAQSGFDLDLSNLRSGNSFQVSVTDPVPGTQRTVTFVRVDDPSALPLGNDYTSDPNDTVFGIDFSGGFAAAAAAVNAALGANVSALDMGGNVLRFLDDGGPGLSNVHSARAVVTQTSLTSGSAQLPFFVDGARTPPDYTASLDGSPQKRGFAGRIALNSSLISDPSRLVVFSTSPLTGAGDPTRPTFLADQLKAQFGDFSPGAGIGSASAPYRGSIGEYLQRVVDFQTGQAAGAKQTLDAKTLVKDALAQRFDQESGVNMDRELAELLVLQNAFAANARVLQVVDELYDTILRI